MNVYCSPDTEDIENYLRSNYQIGKKVLHIVPTMILLRRRLKFYFNLLRPYLDLQVIRNKESKPEIEIRKIRAVFEIDEFIKSSVYQSSSAVLSKSESSVLLQRVMKENPTTNSFSWNSVVTDLNTFFNDLNSSGIPSQELRTFEQSEKWRNVIDLYELYLAELTQTNKLDFGQAFYETIYNLDISKYDELILDGAFLPFTAKHQMLIDKFQQQNKNITLLLPYDLEENNQSAQKAIESVYENYVPRENWRSIQRNQIHSFFINRLPKLIFQDEKPTHLDSSFELLRFSTLENELSFIIQKINTLIRRKNVDPKQIVIITPNAMELRPLVREISEQHGLKVDLPRRPLMHLLHGRAIKHLFDIYVDVKRRTDTYFTSSMLQTFLHESIFCVSKDSLLSFEKIESFFVDCNSIDEWLKAMENVMIAKQHLDVSKYPHHPLAHVELVILEEIHQVIVDVSLLSKQLISAPSSTVKEHVKRLINVLQNNHRFSISISDNNIFERIKMIALSLETQERLQITSQEFGQRISGLFSEQEEYNPGDIAPVDENAEDLFIHRGILVTGPNNVEFQRYQYVFVCRFTQDVYPESKLFNWLQSKQIEMQILNRTTKQRFSNLKQLELFYLDRSMYHVYLSFCAADTQLTISYSQLDNGVELSPAHYLHDISKVFGIEEGNRLQDKSLPSIEKLLEQANVLKNPERLGHNIMQDQDISTPQRFINDTIFTVEDVAVYQYCGRRFYYQKKYPTENIYQDIFHLQAYASSCLYEKAVEELVSAYPDVIHEQDQKRQQKLMSTKINDFCRSAESMVRPLFPVSLRIWHNIELQTKFFLTTLVNNIFDNGFVREYRKNGNHALTVRLFMSTEPREIQVHDFSYFAHKELEVQYNHGRIHRYSISNRKDFLYFNSNEYDEKERMDEIKQWYNIFTRQFYSNDPAAISLLQEITTQIKQGNFAKQPGGHCKFCTFNKLCQEREVD